MLYLNVIDTKYKQSGVFNKVQIKINAYIST